MKDRIQQLSTRIEKIEQYKQEEQQLQKKTTLLAQQYANSKQQLQKLHFQIAADKKESVRLDEQKQQMQAEKQQLLTQLQQQLQFYQIDFKPCDSNRYIKILTQRQQQWHENNEQQSTLKQQYNTYCIQYKNSKEDHSKLEQQEQQQTHKLTQIQQEIAALTQQRSSLFAQKSADTEEQQMQKQVDTAANDYEKYRQQYTNSQKEHDIKQQQQSSLSNLIQQQIQQLSQLESQFKQHLVDKNFAKESDCQAALLSQTDLQKYTQIRESLRTRQLKLDTLKEENQHEKIQLEHENISSENLPDLQSQMLEKQQEYAALNQAMGAISAVLKQHKQQLKRFSAQLVLKEQQQSEYRRWDKLHQLIGSADGKKFRNFAQGLTFEIMISHANEQLQKMNDRYLLIHSKTPLELNVIDKHQAGEIRSIKNLSGGESFIVSLALALGLSQMASQNIQIDSLFLDEGFGSLDEDTLETVLEALSKLHQENKIIGVISHVSGLKERISSQIQVISNQQGKSRLFGAGIKQYVQA
jgi:exonuclease SbcC